MKILYYNWVQFDDPEKRGGGVSVYLKNLIDHLMKQNIDVYFLSSGLSYNFFKKYIYLKKTQNIFGQRCKSFEIVNSHVMSPGHFSFRYVQNRADDIEMTAVFDKFLTEHGPFNVVHFHNLEGIPLNFLKLKDNFFDTKIFVTLHNYFSFCPQVNLWRREEQNCRNFRKGAGCVNCLTYEPPYKAALRAHQLAFMLKFLGFGPEKRFFKFAFKHITKLKVIYRWIYATTDPLKKDRNLTDENNKLTIEGLKSAKKFDARRRMYVSSLNDYCDGIIAVSKRTATLARDFNIDDSKLSVVYIGTKQAEHIKAKRKPPRQGAVISFIFMGYMRKDKGFYFLLDALTNLHPAVASRMRIVIAAPITDRNAVQRLKAIADKFQEIVIYDGYTHRNLPKILEGIDVGIVPVLWEDNLPQVAVELVANGIPIITSDLGGSSELSQCKAFVFPAGSINKFEQVVTKIIDDPQCLESYWNKTLTLRTMDMHINELLDLYNTTGTSTSGSTGANKCEADFD